MSKRNKMATIFGEYITITSDEFISLINMPKVKDDEFAIINNSAGLNSYKISVKQWGDKTS